jgi:4-hydroxy-tetrahydrodipicolinate synthase
MAAQTVAALAKIDTIVGIKEASGDLMQCSQILKNVPESFSVLSGDDGLTLPILSIGGRGVISVTANILPDKISGMVRAWLNGDAAKARTMHFELLEINNAMFIETNPMPVKTALAMMGKLREEFKLPLAPMESTNREKLAAVLKAYGCI